MGLDDLTVPSGGWDVATLYAKYSKYSEPINPRIPSTYFILNKIVPPVATANNTIGDPRDTPNICGTVFLNPYIAPEFINMTLLGPGVIIITMAKTNNDKIEPL